MWKYYTKNESSNLNQTLNLTWSGCSWCRLDINLLCSSRAYCTLQRCLQACGLSVVTPLAPITVQQLVGIQSLGKRGKNIGKGGWGEKSREGDSLWWVGGLQKQSQNLKTKFTTEGKQKGQEKSVGEERKREEGEKRKLKWGRIWIVVGWGPEPRLHPHLPPLLRLQP